MITKYQQSWQLFKASIAVTFRHRKLLWFPVLTTLLTMGIAVFFLVPMALPALLHQTGYRLDQKQHWKAVAEYYLPAHAVPAKSPGAEASTPEASKGLSTQNVGSIGTGPTHARGSFGVSLYLLVIYFLSMFLATFFNVAFYHEIIAALDGRGVSFERGLRAAWNRLPSIFAWSLMAGVVGWIIRSIEERLPFAGRLITGLIGMAWSVAAVFAIPVIIQEQSTRNPIRILKQSALTLKRTWGESLIGYLGFSAGNLVVFMSSLLPLMLAGVAAFLLKNVWIIAIAGALWLMGLLVIAYIIGVAGNVFRCALYKYATEGVVPEPYNQDLLDQAWKVKTSSWKH